MADTDELNRTEKLRLLNGIRNLTLSGTIAWRRLKDGPEYVRYANMADYILTISSVDDDGVAPIKLVIQKVASRDEPLATLRMMPLDEGGDAEVNHLILELYNEAIHRSRKKADDFKQLFSTLESLESEPPF